MLRKKSHNEGMKFEIQILFLVLLFTVISGQVFAQSESIKVLKLRSDAWCPLACESVESPGLIVEITRKILEPQGYKIDFAIINWARAVSDTREGVFDGIAGASVGDAPDFVFPKEEQALVTYEIFTLNRSHWKFNGKWDGRKIAVINGYNYDETVNNLIEKKHPSFVVVSGDNAQEQIMKMLLAGRVDAVYENPAVFRHNIEILKLKESDFRSAGAPSQKPQKTFVAFGPKLKDAKVIAGLIDQGMKTLKRNGDLKKLMEKYHFKSGK